MSDSMRSLPRRKSTYRRRHRRLGGTIGRLLLYVLVGLLVWAFWVTRDTYSMSTLIPQGQAYNVYLHNILEKRDTIMNSEVWSLLPQSQPIPKLAELDTLDFGVPDWVVNNLMHDVCQISGNDMEEFSDVLFVTKMSRIGTLLERVFDWFSPAEHDYAGGLDLRALPGEDLYYAVRGRVLLVSRSRDSLIKALTLQSDTAMGPEVFNQAMEEMGGEDIHAHFQFEEDTPWGAYLEDLRIALMIEPGSAWLGCRVSLNPQTNQHMAPLLAGLEPAQLHEPPPGAVTASLNFNRPVDALWGDFKNALGNLQGNDASPLAFLESWQQNEDPEGELPLQQLFTSVLGQVEEEFTITWAGIDQHEMIPAPELMLLATPTSNAVQTLLEAVPEDAPVDTATWESTPRRSVDSELVYVPMIGGRSIEPTIGMLDNKVILSTSHRLAEDFMFQPLPEAPPVSSPANIFLKVYPQVLVQDLYETGLQLASIGAIKNHTESSYREAGDYYLNQAASIEDIAALASYVEEEIHLDIKLRMTETQTETTE